MRQNLFRLARSIPVAMSIMLLVVRDASAQAAVGSLRVKSDVAQVQVFLDGADVGVTPLTLSSVASGKRFLLLSKPGYADQSDSVIIDAAKPASLFIIMKKLETALPTLPVKYRVAHAHAAGGCVGTMVVQRDTIVYTADDARDVFAVPIRSVRMVLRGSGVNWLSLAGSVATGVATGMATGVAVTPVQTAQVGTGSMIPLRIETANRNFTFLAFDGGENLGAVPQSEIPRAQIAMHNQALFQTVYQLYLADLKNR
ncbi:MAG: PEGA domain-containing protein [Gemmatimonas sp.]